MSATNPSSGPKPARRRLLKSDAVDAAVVALSIVSVLAIGVWLWFGYRSQPRTRSTPVGSLLESSGDVRRRSVDSVGWEPLPLGAPIFANDALFAGRTSEATIELGEGASLNLHPLSLVFVRSDQKRSDEVELRHGSVSVRSRNPGLSLRSLGQPIRLDSDTQLTASRSEAGGSVQLLSGTMTLGDTSDTVSTPGVLELDEKGSVRDRRIFEVSLLSPARLARIGYDPETQVELLWKSSASAVELQVARSRDFRAPVIRLRVDPEVLRYRFPSPRPDTYWWRLVDEEDQPLSEARSFTVFSPRTPEPIFPESDEIVYAPDDRGITFQWTEVPHASEYLFELGRDPDLSTPLVSARRRQTRVFVGQTFDEGRYYWRVRPIHRDEAPASGVPDAVRFAVQHVPLGAAPRVIGEEIRIDAD